MNFLVVKDYKSFLTACDYLNKAEVLGFDLETTELSPRDGEIRLAQFSDGDKTVVFDIRKIVTSYGADYRNRSEHYNVFKPLKEILENPNIKKVIHYAQFEYKWVKWCFDSEINALFDTYLASILINFDLTRHSLSSVAREYLNIELDKTEQRSDWKREELSDEQYEYAALDVYYLPKLREIMFQRLVDDNQLMAAKIDFESVAPISVAEETRIHVNRELYENEIKVFKELRNVASENLQEILRSTRPSSPIQQSMFDIPEKNFSDVLLSSPAQIKEALVALGLPIFAESEVDKIQEYEKAGKPYAVGTGAKALGSIAGMHPVLNRLSDFRGVEQMVKNFGDKFLEHLVDYGDEWRVGTTFSIIGARTGRMSSRNVNVQQIPDKTLTIGDEEYHIGVRKAFDFKEGRVGVSCDFSQIELRIVAELSGCPIFLDAFNTGKDLHAQTASLIYNVPYEQCADENHEFYKKYRKPSKNINFGIVYGIGPPGLAAQLKIDVEEAREIINKHRESHPVLWSYLDRQADKAVKTLKASTMSGRLQRFNKPTLDENGQPNRKEVGAIGRNGKNMPIQGCLGGDSRIYIQGRGYVKIKDAVEEGKQELWDGESLTTGFVVNSGEKQVVKITLSNGEVVTCSPNHKFWARKSRHDKESWIEAKDLYGGCSIQVTNNLPTFDFLDKSEFKSVSHLSSYNLGLLVGILDRNLKTRDGKYFVLHLNSNKERTYTELIRLLDLSRVKYTKEEVVYRNAFHNKIIISDPEFVKDYNELTCREGLKEYVWSSKEYLAGYLKGFVTPSVFYQYGMLQFWCLSKQHKQDVSKALMLFGVEHASRGYSLRDSIILNGLSVFKFLLTIGLIEDERVSVFARSFDKLQRRLSEAETEPSFINIIRVVLTDSVEVMYDVVDSDTSVFMADGLVTHNTSADIIKRALKLIYDRLKGKDAAIVNIIHDEVMVETDASIAEEVKSIVEQSMIEAGEEFLKKVPVKADAKVVQSWGEK